MKKISSLSHLNGRSLAFSRMVSDETCGLTRTSQVAEPLRPDSSVREEFCSLITEEWFDSKQAAKFLKISTGSLMNLVSAGKIPYSKLGRRNRYRRSDLHMLLLSERRGANEC